MNSDFEYKQINPDKTLDAFVDSFWSLQNLSESDKEIIVLPDGRIDLIFTLSEKEHFPPILLGLGTHPDNTILTAGTKIVAISFKLLATEYILQNTISNLLNNAQNLSDDFWDFSADDLKNVDNFCIKATQKIQSLLPKEIDRRKQKLFDFIYSSNGEITVKELSEKVFWSSRQINRYFNQQFGLSLKTYCSILRFRSSFEHIKQGKLFPQQNFADQSHFIKEIKRLAGVLPKELRKNENDRFIQFSTLDPK
ncbi:helix-turn-helix transcriptional regulator [Fluviicola sp. SGL-29]|nr:helix-turn-helix transcriptional regulator [Fluviicola sp. SGL-29]